MAFKQGKRAAVTVPKTSRSTFRGDLLAMGYRPHTRARTKRAGEIQAWVRSIGRGRQVHVQEELLEDGSIDVFAHTEPAGQGLNHLVAAVFDRVSFAGGAKVLLGDLRERGWDV
jgi:hypothetical protein